MKQNQPTFLIADDHSIVRQGISLLIKELFFSAKIFHAGSFKEILQIIRENKIDIIILDIISFTGQFYKYDDKPFFASYWL